ncbi:LOW QUALITY PROTEIN: probable ADP-ribosylation factor GTPase-activating protein AGD14 [Oryza brachyantha]|uniref:LOW QUALITY PROTEIN: probable ADP-ribosylation factor GTPase-activating protein AGD14 n=1 Tax=Oryza brachyantha TaxID=4533 RepID=UPI001ADC3257|nr:LOW QUALITY PROTEIN: probable ADP-ribosylation factor GTPase-activating protein AGD14 [Oryza brachyantha]
MGSRREEERNEKIIRGLMKLPPNRKCINCNSVGPQYVCTNFWTFICLSCSGIHREFTHRVKSVSMAKFSTQEVRALEQGGNQRARDIYLKDWDWQRMRLPDNSNPDRIREFIRAVYVDKKYAGGNSSNKPVNDSESVKSSENDMRRPSSYHSYSQSPPYDFQYEDRRYGKQVDTLARRPSDRALFDGKLGSLLYSPGRLRDQMHEDRFANESSGSRFSDFSASSTGDFRNDVLSPSSQDTGYSSPSIHHSRNVSSENPPSHRHPNATSQTDFNGVRRSQRTGSSGSFGSFDGSSTSNKSVDLAALPDAPAEKPVHSAVNRETFTSPVAHSAQVYTSQSNKNSSVSQTPPTRESVHHGKVHMVSVAPLPVSTQPVTSTNQNLFDQSMQHPVTSAAPIDLFAGFNQQTSSASHKTVDLGSHSAPKETLHDVVIQKAVASSPPVQAEALTTSHPVHQDLLSLSTLQEPSISSTPPAIDLFAGFDQQLPPVTIVQQSQPAEPSISSTPPSIDLFAGFDQQLLPITSVQQSQPAVPLVAEEGWAFFLDTPQHTPIPNVQAQVPAAIAALPPSDNLAKGINQSALPTVPPNALMPQSCPLVMDQWSLNAQEVKAPVSKESSQSWNAFGEPSGNTTNDSFTFNTMSQAAPHHFNVPSIPHAEARSPEDWPSSELEKPIPGDITPGINVSPGDMAGPSFHGPLQPQLDVMASQPAKSTNPFDMAFESDVEASGMFMDLTSLQAALPNPHVNSDYSNLTEPWIPHNSSMPYISSGQQGILSFILQMILMQKNTRGLSYMAKQVPDSLMLSFLYMKKECSEYQTAVQLTRCIPISVSLQQVNYTKIEPDGMPHFASENGERRNMTGQKARFNSGRDCRDGRQFGPSGGRGRGRSFNQGRGRGNNNWRDVKPKFRSSDSPSPASGQRRNDSPASGGQRKRPPIIYDANEVKQWLEARKKNYPSSVNINKKLCKSQPHGEKKEEEALMRRQELKEVLAKQKELGFELPELPPGYLSENEDQGNGRKSNWKNQSRDRRFGNHANNKRSRYDRKDFQSKRPKVWNQTRCDDGAMVKSREPSLLQKLLSPDVKRDRHRLLHTFKFMILNNFFSDYPDKPLEFPSVKVNQNELESNVAAEELDDLMNNGTAEGSNLDLEENDDQKESSSVDGESSLDDNNDEEGDDGNASAESSDKDENEDDDAGGM